MPTSKEIFETKMNALADAINEKAGTTGKKDLDELKDAVDGISVGGDQPTLFAPIVTTGTNSASWENDSRNGGFNVTITATVDGVTVTSPLTITEAMDGKTLVVTASAENFLDAVSQATLTYVAPGQSIAEMSGYEGDVDYPYFYIRFLPGTIGVPFILNGETYSYERDHELFFKANINSVTFISFSFNKGAVSAGVLSAPGIVLLKSSNPSVPVYSMTKEGEVGTRVRVHNYSWKIKKSDGSVLEFGNGANVEWFDMGQSRNYPNELLTFEVTLSF